MHSLSAHLRRLKFLGTFVFIFCVIRWAPQLWIVDKFMRTDSRQWWLGFQKDSDNLVLLRLRENINHGYFSSYGALGDFGSYNSQFGLGSWLATIASTAFHLAESSQIFILYSITALGNTLLVIGFLFIVKLHLGRLATLVAFVLLIQPWPSAMFHSVYWSIWIKFLPAAATYFVYRYKISALRRLAVITVCSVFTFLSGYEFSTLVIISAISVIFFFEKFEIRHIKSLSNKIGMGASPILSGFFIALIVHFIQLVGILGSSGSALSYLLETITKRTGATNIKVNSAFTESLQSSPIQVLNTYLEFPIIGSPKSIPVVGALSIAAFILIVYLLTLTTISLIPENTCEQLVMTLSVWLVGLLGPLGWIFLARPHSYIHTHVNFSLWYLFTIPLGGALVARSLLFVRESTARIKDLLFLSTCMSLAVICFASYSFFAVSP